MMQSPSRSTEDYIAASLDVLRQQLMGIYLSLDVNNHDQDSFLLDIVKPALEFWRTDELALTIRKSIINPPVDPIVAQLRIANLFLMHAHAMRVDGRSEYSVAWSMEAHYQFGVLEQTVDDRIAAIAKSRGAYKGKFRKFGRLWARTLQLARERAWESKAKAADAIAKTLQQEKDSLGQYLTTGHPEVRIKKWLTELLPPLEHDRIFPRAKAARRDRPASADDGRVLVDEYVPRMFLHEGHRIVDRPVLPRIRSDLQQAYAAWTPEPD